MSNFLSEQPKKCYIIHCFSDYFIQRLLEYLKHDDIFHLALSSKKFKFDKVILSKIEKINSSLMKISSIYFKKNLNEYGFYEDKESYYGDIDYPISMLKYEPSFYEESPYFENNTFKIFREMFLLIKDNKNESVTEEKNNFYLDILQCLKSLQNKDFSYYYQLVHYLVYNNLSDEFEIILNFLGKYISKLDKNCIILELFFYKKKIVSAFLQSDYKILYQHFSRTAFKALFIVKNDYTESKIEIIKDFIRNFIRIDSNLCICLMNYIIDSEIIELIEYSIELGFSANYIFKTFMYCYSTSTKVLDSAIKYGANVNKLCEKKHKHKQTYLYEFCYGCFYSDMFVSFYWKYILPKINFLISNGLNINHQDIHGNTALMFLCLPKDFQHPDKYKTYRDEKEPEYYDYDEDTEIDNDSLTYNYGFVLFKYLINIGTDIHICNYYGENVTILAEKYMPSRYREYLLNI